MNDSERKQWVENDERLRDWWKDSRQSLPEFISENRYYIDRQAFPEKVVRQI